MPADTTLAPYEALAPVYDAWTADNEYPRWAAFIVNRLPATDDRVPRVLDLCCGTGTMSALLRDKGYAVTGVDRSPQMLDRARERLGPDVPVVRGDVRQFQLPGTFDAAVCTFDSINYLVEDGDLAATLGAAAAALRPGGVLIFDVNTRRKLERMLGDSHYGDDLDEFAYVWRNSYDAATHRNTFRITVFRRQEGGHFTRYRERHQQRWFSHAEIHAAATTAGFEVTEVRDDYGPQPPTETTLRETWVLRRPATR